MQANIWNKGLAMQCLRSFLSLLNVAKTTPGAIFADEDSGPEIQLNDFYHPSNPYTVDAN